MRLKFTFVCVNTLDGFCSAYTEARCCVSWPETRRTGTGKTSIIVDTDGITSAVMTFINTLVNISTCYITSVTSVTYTAETTNIVDASWVSATSIVRPIITFINIFTLITITLVTFVTFTFISSFVGLPTQDYSSNQRSTNKNVVGLSRYMSSIRDPILEYWYILHQRGINWTQLYIRQYLHTVTLSWNNHQYSDMHSCRYCLCILDVPSSDEFLGWMKKTVKLYSLQI